MVFLIISKVFLKAHYYFIQAFYAIFFLLVACFRYQNLKALISKKDMIHFIFYTK